MDQVSITMQIGLRKLPSSWISRYPEMIEVVNKDGHVLKIFRIKFYAAWSDIQYMTTVSYNHE